MNTTFRRVYIVLGAAAFLTFFGHAMWAVRAKDSFVELVTGSFDNVLGVSVGTDTAETLVRVIGYWDLVVAATMALAVIGFVLGRGRLYELALSPLMLAVWTWATIWGFTTGAARMSGAGVWYPEVWDLVERGPNFLVPASLVVMTLALRRGEASLPAASEQRPTVPVRERGLVAH